MDWRWEDWEKQHRLCWRLVGGSLGLRRFGVGGAMFGGKMLLGLLGVGDGRDGKECLL